LDERSEHVNPAIVRALVGAGADPDASTLSGRRPIEAAAQRLLPATVATFLNLGAAPANALTAVLVWWAANISWAKYRAGVVVDVIETLRAGGAVVSDRHRQMAAKGEVEAVAAALDA
jgi:hypothetical protein